jgi:hypothetical protein
VRGVDVGSAHGITQCRVGREDPRHQQSDCEQPEEDGAADRSAGASDRQPQADREQQGEDAADQEIDYLHPSSGTRGELAHVVAPGAVSGPCSALDEEHGDEEKRTDDAGVEKLFNAAQLTVAGAAVVSRENDL